MPTFIYFPFDSDTTSATVYQQTLNFSRFAIESRESEEDGDIYISRLGFNVGMTTSLQALGFDFTGFYGDIYAQLCDGCASISIVAYGKHLLFYLPCHVRSTCTHCLLYFRILFCCIVQLIWSPQITNSTLTSTCFRLTLAPAATHCMTHTLTNF